MRCGPPTLVSHDCSPFALKTAWGDALLRLLGAMQVLRKHHTSAIEKAKANSTIRRCVKKARVVRFRASLCGWGEVS